ncbi:MAG: prolipoprotein diacylglyceryl transferase [Spirochaetes bacterium]|nr:prolipoprotein diacylglyceryl transferase [Spirochaetota bacterium]
MLPINLKIGLLQINDYEGLYFLIAVICGFIYFILLSRDEKLNLNNLYTAIFISLISSLVMGRLFSFIFWRTEVFFSKPWIFFIIWKYPGSSITGCIIGGLTAAYLFFKIKKLDFFYNMKFIIPPIVLGQIVGRFGCFLNGDAAGKPTDLPWGIIFNSKSSAYYNIPAGTPLHPTQLYEIAGNLIFLIFLIITGNNNWITNRRVIWFAFNYSILRFIIEFFRNDTEKLSWIPFLTSGQLISLSGFVVAVILLIWSVINNDKLVKNQWTNPMADILEPDKIM